MSDRPSISELQRTDVECRCGGEFSRSHNPERGCPRHGNLSHHVADRESILNAAPVLLEIAAAALALAGPSRPSDAHLPEWNALIHALGEVRP